MPATGHTPTRPPHGVGAALPEGQKESRAHSAGTLVFVGHADPPGHRAGASVPGDAHTKPGGQAPGSAEPGPQNCAAGHAPEGAPSALALQKNPTGHVAGALELTGQNVPGAQLPEGVAEPARQYEPTAHGCDTVLFSAHTRPGGHTLEGDARPDVAQSLPPGQGRGDAAHTHTQHAHVTRGASTPNTHFHSK